MNKLIKKILDFVGYKYLPLRDFLPKLPTDRKPIVLDPIFYNKLKQAGYDMKGIIKSKKLPTN